MTAASTTVLAAPTQKPTAAEAERFLSDTEAKLNKLNNEQARRMGRFQLHHRRYRSDSLLLRRALLTASGEAAIGARRFNGLKLSAGSARKMMLLQQTLVFADPKSANSTPPCRRPERRLRQGQILPEKCRRQPAPAWRWAKWKKCWPPAAMKPS
jgi:hypothetical protein